MNKRNNTLHQQASFAYEQLEPRQLLTSIAYFSGGIHHLPQDGTRTIFINLDEAPEIVSQPENGELLYDEARGTLVYRPDQGFVGVDSFQTGDSAQPITTKLRVWETAYAVPDWALVKPGESTSVAALDNDYAFRDSMISYLGRDPFTWQQDSTGFKIVSFTSNSGASVSISEDGRMLNYTAVEGFVGEDIVSYTLEDEFGHRSESTITFDVSNKDPDSRYFVSESQYRQQQIESWMKRYASSMTTSRFFYQPIIFDGGSGVWARTTTFGFASTANVSADRVANAQEGDIVKSHGDRLYYVTHDDGSGEFESYLSIVDLSDPSNPSVISTTGFDTRIQDIFLDDGRVAVVMSNGPYFSVPGSVPGAWHSPKDSFQLLVMDVSDSTEPTEVYRATIDGSYSDARLIGDELYIVSSTRHTAPSPLELENRGLVDGATSPRDFIDAVLENDPSFGSPTITVDSNGDTESIAVSHEQVVRRDDAYSNTLIATFNIQDNTGQPADMDLIQTNWINTVYVSDQSMYLFDGTSVIKLDFLKQDSGLEFSADGELKGRLISQFAANEFEGNLRVAITDNADRSSDILVFTQTNDKLLVKSHLENIAPGEQVYSAHFEGDKGFVVTFRRIDPLFVIDLADPANPQIAGELKIPGVSNHLQWIGDGLLLAVGRDANPDTGRLGGLQVSLFDVSDSNNPQLLDRYTFEGGFSTSTPLIRSINSAPEHHALTFDFDTGTLALPIFSSGKWPGVGEQPIFEGENSSIALFNVDRENGIQISQQVDFDSKALRTIITGNHLVYLSEDGLKTAARLTPHEVIASMDLPTETAQQLAARPVTQNTSSTILEDQPSTNNGSPSIAEIDSESLARRRSNFFATPFSSSRTPLTQTILVQNADWTDSENGELREASSLSGSIVDRAAVATTSVTIGSLQSDQAQFDESGFDEFFADFDEVNESVLSDTTFEEGLRRRA